MWETVLMPARSPMNYRSLKSRVLGEGLGARAIRGSALTFLGYGGAQFMRLLSNLILTRLLFPEAFGLMALVQVFMAGLQMFSDTGTATSILQSKRGDDPAFLNTAWTAEIVRGALLWLIILASAGAVAAFYAQPMLAELLPVAGLVVVIQSLRSTKIVVANRHLLMGRITVLELASQFIGILTMIGLAWAYESVWALVVGTLVATSVRTVLSHTWFPGPSNRLQFERDAFWELFHFGKFIFVASIAGFLVNHADRGILGKFIDIGELGIYNIAYFLATVPMMLSKMLGNRIMIPLYRERPPVESADNLWKARRARLSLFAVLFAMTFFTALLGDWIIWLLYEPEYAYAGPILVLLPLAYLPFILNNAYSSLLLSAGNSRTFTMQTVVLAIVQMIMLLWGVSNYGVIGAILAPPLASLLLYPMIAYFAHRQGGLDLPLDIACCGVSLLACIVVVAVHPDAFALVLAGNG